MAKAKKKAKKASPAKKKVTKKKTTKAPAKNKTAKKKTTQSKLAAKKKATKKPSSNKKVTKAKKKVAKKPTVKKKPAAKKVTKKKIAPAESGDKKKKTSKVQSTKANTRPPKDDAELSETGAAVESPKPGAPAPRTAKAGPTAPKGALKGKAKELEEDDVDDLAGDIGDDDLGDEDTDYEVEEEDDDDFEESSSSETEDDWDEDSDEVILTDAEGRRYCKVRDCDQISGVEGYCRYHYLLFWKRIQTRKKILKDGKLRSYIEELTSRYSDKHLEMLRKDLKSEKDFLAAIRELEIDESSTDSDYEDEAQNFIAEVRGLQGSDGGNDDDDY